ncbi:TonB-dependent siderophore receptor [Lichenihabitans sp. Uapishka_5]|uniref:TonB-dependent siderophore receptor n=1 Tax=Lichenihabitans sp. Uapishka_5 TaxID=3037302 RepID=UPI0029E7D408|nr:TonB-dependent siderophore receptor [Lichenihabitans sp. Uapishka_5]MDX7951526.1 TonB-dependent siderophore receptor [Lichenihabitans sp. Uapishka_5]
MTKPASPGRVRRTHARTGQDPAVRRHAALYRCGLMLLPALAAAPASAQTAAPAQVQLDAIDVEGAAKPESGTGPINGYVASQSTAGTKSSTPLNRTPQSISVIGTRQIEDQKPDSIEQALRYSPGAVQQFGFDPRTDFILIRGFSAEQIGYYLDNLQLFSNAFASYKLDPWNLERIEVVEGPSSVLYGGGSPGGLVNAVSKLPTFTTFGVVEAGVNNFGNAYGAVDIGGVAGDRNQWAYRFVSDGHIGDTQVKHTEDDHALVAPSLTYRPDAATALTLLGQYQRDWTNNPNFLPYEGTVKAAPYGRIPTNLFTSEPSVDTFEREQSMVGTRFESALTPFFTVRQNFRFSHLNVLESSLYGGGYANGAASAELARYQFLTQPYANQVSVDNQAETRFATGALQHDLLLGLDYKHYFLHDDQAFAFGSNLNLVNPFYTPTTLNTFRYNDNNQTVDQTGLYGQDQISFDRLTVVGAVREDFVSTDQKSRSTGTGFTSNPDATTGKVGVIYNLDNGIAPYVSYATSFNPVIGTNTATNLPLVPETGEQEEVGVKYQSPSLPITARIALFNLTRDNVSTTDPLNVQNTIQTGQVRSRGLELSAQANLTDGLSLIGAYTAYDLEVTKDLNTAIIGNVLTATPQQFGSLWLDYTLQDGYLRGLGFGAGVRYVGHSFADQANSLEVPSYVLGDAAIHYDTGHWRAAVNLQNIADTTYVSSCSSGSACFYGDRRKIIGTLAYKW